METRTIVTETINQVFFVLTISLALAIIGLVIRGYYRNRFSTFLYLGAASFFFIVQEILITIGSEHLVKQDEGLPEVQEFILPVVTIIISLIGSIYFLALFLHAYESDRLMTRKYIIITMIFVMLVTGLLMAALELQFVIPQMEDKSMEEIWKVSGPTIVFFSLLSLSSLLFTLGLSFDILLELSRRIATVTNPKVKKDLQHIRYAIIAMYLASGVSGALQALIGLNIGGFFALLAFVYLVYYYSKTDSYILQARSLKKLLVISSSDGLPVYSYDFESIYSGQVSKEIAFEDREALFSGAIKATSVLFSEFTGQIDQDIREVQIGNVTMMANKMADGQLSMILLTERSTKFFREALDKVSFQFSDFYLTENVEPSEILSKNQVRTVNSMIERNFGASTQISETQESPYKKIDRLVRIIKT